MLTTNLLPPEEKKLLQREKVRRIIAFFALGTSFVFLFGSTLLLPTFLPVLFERREVIRTQNDERQVAHNLRVEEITRRASDVQALSQSVKKYLEKSGRASELLDAMRAILPEDVSLSKFEVGKDGMVLIGGFAATRSALLKYEKALRDSERFESKITVPNTSLTQETNISFSLQGKLKPAFFLY